MSKVSKRLDPKQRTLNELPKSAPVLIPVQKRNEDPIIVDFLTRLYLVRTGAWNEHREERWRRLHYFEYRQLMRDFARDGFIQESESIWEMIKDYGPK